MIQSDQLHGAKTPAKIRVTTRAKLFVASNSDKTPKRRYWLLSQYGAKKTVSEISCKNFRRNDCAMRGLSQFDAKKCFHVLLHGFLHVFLHGFLHVFLHGFLHVFLHEFLLHVM